MKIQGITRAHHFLRLLISGICLLLSFTNISAAEETKKQSNVIDLSDTIVGNQEQPTVLYIVPWKSAEDTTILYLPLDPKAMDNLFGHVERTEHTRQVKYIEELAKE